MARLLTARGKPCLELTVSDAVVLSALNGAVLFSQKAE